METQVLQCLQATLSPQESIRTEAEGQLKQLFLLPEGGLSLARLLASPEVPIDFRQVIYDSSLLELLAHDQSAGVLLQKYILSHWSFLSTSFSDPACPPEVKAQIRDITFRGLSDPSRKVRSAAAFAVSTVAKYDWPEDWPTLLTDLVNLLAGSADSVHGAMRVVAEFVKNDLSEDQLLPVVRDLAPALLKILAAADVHSASTRASTVNVFRQVLKMLETVRDEHPASVKEAMSGLMPTWLGAFTHILGSDIEGNWERSWEEITIRLEIYRTLSFLLSAFPRIIAPHLPSLLQYATTTLQGYSPQFLQYYVSSDPDAPEPPSPTSDLGFGAQQDTVEDLACAIFDFLTPAVRQKSVDTLLGGSSQAEQWARSVVELVLIYTRVTRTNEEEWMEDANNFIEDDDEETEMYGLRLTGHDLIGSLLDKWSPAAGIIQQCTSESTQLSASLKQRNDPGWWKPLEAALSLIGGISDDVKDLAETAQSTGAAAPIDAGYWFNNVIPDLLNSADTPFLQGRAFIFASQFADELGTMAERYLAAAVEAMASDEVSIPVKISAVKTVKNFCRHVGEDVIRPHAGRIITLLLPLLDEAEREVLYLLLETIRAVIGLNKSLLTDQTVAQLVEPVFQAWLRHTQDPVATAIVEEMVESLSTTSPQVCRALVLHLCPKLAEAIATPTTDETVHIPAEAIQLGNALLRGRGSDIEPELVGSVTSAVLDVLDRTDDMDAIQHGVIHVTYIVRKDVQKLISWRDASGNNGIARVFGLLGRLLQPTFSESGSLYVGELILHLFRKAAGDIGPVLPDLSRVMVERLVTAKLSTFLIMLVLPFAYLFGTDYTDSTIELLSGIVVHTPEGQKNGLQVVLGVWTENADTISGSWDLRVSAIGMSKLFVLPDERLRGIIVRGDMIITEAQRHTIMTRSKTRDAPIQYTQIPFPVKSLKLLLKDVQHASTAGSKSTTAGLSGLDGLEDDDGDEEWDDDDLLGGAEDDGDFLSSWMDMGAKNDNAQDDDEDLKEDPISQIDLAQHLTGVLRGCYADNRNGMHEMVEALSDGEKGILRGTLTA